MKGKQDRSGGARVGAGARVLLVRRIDDGDGDLPGRLAASSCSD